MVGSMRSFLFGLALAVSSAAPFATGCAGVEKAAARDPMKCERDPNCDKKKDKSADCITQCADNLECADRCRSVTGQR